MNGSGRAAEIVMAYLLEQGAVLDPIDFAPAEVDSIVWPGYVGRMQDAPDEAVCMYDSGGILQGRLQRSGVTQVKEDVQLVVRSKSYALGQLKIKQLTTLIDDVKRHTINMDAVVEGEDPSEFMIHSLTILSDVIPLGPDDRQRETFAVNIRTTIRQVTGA